MVASILRHHWPHFHLYNNNNNKYNNNNNNNNNNEVMITSTNANAVNITFKNWINCCSLHQVLHRRWCHGPYGTAEFDPQMLASPHAPVTPLAPQTYLQATVERQQWRGDSGEATVEIESSSSLQQELRRDVSLSDST